MLKFLLYAVPIGLAIFALIELSRSEPHERADVHPLAWAAIIILLPFLGPIAWILISRHRRNMYRGGAANPSAGVRRPTAAPRGPVAPDDDPEFLWRLEQRRRRAAAERAAREAAAGDTGSAQDEEPKADDDEPGTGTTGPARN